MSARSLFLVAAALSVPLLGGCSESSPTGPDPVEDPVMNLETDVTVTRVEAIKDGDGIEGRGEFYFYRQVGGSGIGWEANLSSGQSQTLNWKKVLLNRNFDGTGTPFTVEFQATEYDKDITGHVYADSDMDARMAAAHYVTSPDLQETNYITLGNDKCKVRLHYTIRSHLVAAD
jgi:hypothetical protein